MGTTPALENVPHVHHQVAVGKAALDGVAEDLRAHRLHAVRDFAGAALFYFAQDGDQLSVSDFANGPVADLVEQVDLQPTQYVLGRALAPSGNFVGVPVPRDLLKGIRGLFKRQALGIVAMLGGVNPVGQQTTRLLQRDFGVAPNREGVFLAVLLAKLEGPGTRTAACDIKEQPSTIKQLVRLVAGLGIPDLYFR